VSSRRTTPFPGSRRENGVTFQEGDRALVTGQTLGAQNCIYYTSSGAWQRAQDVAAENFLVVGMIVLALEGTQAGLWRLSSPTNGTITLGSTPLTFVPLADALPLRPTYVDPGVHASATGVYTESTLTFASSIGLRFDDADRALHA
jgi:hypothetical protein